MTPASFASEWLVLCYNLGNLIINTPQAMTETIVLIHGYGFDHRIWLPVELAFEGYHTLYLSLPGFGDNGDLSAYSIPKLAAEFWTDLDVNLAPKVHLVGHSMGGYVCLEMAAQHPERVSSLALIHSHAYEDNAEKKTQRSTTMEDIQSKGHEPLVRKMIPSMIAEKEKFSPLVNSLMDRGLHYPKKAWYYGTQAMRDRKDHAATLEKMKVPVLLVAGEKDSAVPIDNVYKMASLLERAKLCVYPNVGHMSMFENTAQLICDLRDFYETQ